MPDDTLLSRNLLIITFLLAECKCLHATAISFFFLPGYFLVYSFISSAQFLHFFTILKTYLLSIYL